MDGHQWYGSNYRNFKKKQHILGALILLFGGLSLFFIGQLNYESIQKRNFDVIEDDEKSDLQEYQRDFFLKALSPNLVENKLLALTKGLNELKDDIKNLPIVSSMPNNAFSTFVHLFLPWKIRQKEICDRYNAEGHMRRAVLISPLQIFNKYDSDDVTMVAHMSFSKIQLLDLMLSFWPGPMSIAIYLLPAQLDGFLTALKTHYSHWMFRDNLDLHFVSYETMFYPSNYLRQLALKNIKTKFVFLNDIDFIPQSRLYRELKKHRHQLNATRSVFVVPAFEFKSIPDSFPDTRKHLFLEWEKGNIQPFHYTPNRYYGHRTTNYKKWITATQPYKVTWELYYEPYFMAEAASLPDYDERFLGRWYDKISYIDKVVSVGFELVVLPKVFIIHYIHPVHNEKSYFKCAVQLFHQTHLPEMRTIWQKRGLDPSF